MRTVFSTRMSQLNFILTIVSVQRSPSFGTLNQNFSQGPVGEKPQLKWGFSHKENTVIQYM